MDEYLTYLFIDKILPTLSLIMWFCYVLFIYKSHSKKKQLIDVKNSIEKIIEFTDTQVFWLSLNIPILIGFVIIIVSGFSFEFEVSFKPKSLKFFFDHYRLPLLIFALPIPLSALFYQSYKSIINSKQLFELAKSNIIAEEQKKVNLNKSLEDGSKEKKATIEKKWNEFEDEIKEFMYGYHAKKFDLNNLKNLTSKFKFNSTDEMFSINKEFLITLLDLIIDIYSNIKKVQRRNDYIQYGSPNGEQLFKKYKLDLFFDKLKKTNEKIDRFLNFLDRFEDHHIIKTKNTKIIECISKIKYDV